MDDTNIDRLDPNTTPYIDWFCCYLMANKPCIFTSNITEAWRARDEWILPDGTPNTNFLISTFGNADIPVTKMQANDGYNSQTQATMKLQDFLSIHFRSRDHNIEGGLYLKDWHFLKHFPSYMAYQLPIYFQNDWMNEYWDTKNDHVESDYRFVYIGDKETWTPFHADVFRSHSWSANICGHKRWLLVRPGVELKIQRYSPNDNRNLRADVSTNDMRPILEQHPELRETGGVLDIQQNPGEIIFVPSNWHHQVHNLDSVISINHNWCNSASIDRIWQYLCDRLEAVKQELSDCQSLMNPQDWAEQCQLVLKCDVGMDFREFMSMINLVIEKRLQRLFDFKESPSIPQSLFQCSICSKELVACRRTPDCLSQLKCTLKTNCTCTSASECAFCSKFFTSFDILMACNAMNMVLDTQDASTLPDFVALWRSRAAEFESNLSGSLFRM